MKAQKTASGKISSFLLTSIISRKDTQHYPLRVEKTWNWNPSSSHCREEKNTTIKNKKNPTPSSFFNYSQSYYLYLYVLLL